MSDAIEKTAGGATRVLFGTVAFICLMVGIEGMTGAEKISVGMSALLIAAGAICAYAAVFWETAKSILSDKAQAAIGNFARSSVTKAVLLLAALASIILSPFIEQQRWPFSYPVDPAIISENADLKNTVADMRSQRAGLNFLVNKWKFIHELRDSMGDAQCQYYLNPTPGSRPNAEVFWQEQLRDAGWRGSITGAQSGTMPPGITVRVPDENGPAYRCGGAVQKALSDIYPTPPAKLVVSQTNCGQCVQIDIDH
jgi:hypothetical protein